MHPDEQTNPPWDPPEFRRWAELSENTEEADALIIQFLSDEGVEMMMELITCRGQQHQFTAEHYVGRLADKFETWWEQGKPRVPPAPPPTVTYWTPGVERAVYDYLEANLPTGAVYQVARRMRRLPSGSPQGRSEPLGWYCRIEDGAATSVAHGSSGLQAARKAVEAWREFVTGDRVSVPAVEQRVAPEELADYPAAAKPPKLDAPSTSGATKESEQKRVS
jgi:hypothetical protein